MAKLPFIFEGLGMMATRAALGTGLSREGEIACFALRLC